jgi:uncharacterized protein (TIGR03067 family)
VDVPALLVNATVHAAATFGSAQAGATATAAALAKAFLRAQSLWKWTTAAGVLSGAGLVILLVVFFTRTPKPKTDQELLQGTWKATKIVFVGQEMQADMEMSVAGDQWTTRAGEASRKDSFRLNPGRIPKEIDFIAAQGSVQPGIYRLEADRLQLSVNTQSQERPTDFTGVRFFFCEFQRAK